MRGVNLAALLVIFLGVLSAAATTAAGRLPGVATTPTPAASLPINREPRGLHHAPSPAPAKMTTTQPPASASPAPAKMTTTQPPASASLPINREPRDFHVAAATAGSGSISKAALLLLPVMVAL
ncbi:Os06g0144500 [Oryza sativa Japonica Group]|uniref:Os06g0144500 protein n=1 Tax=Oryza sativa subsp. japonica TaxID=39947 RepID=A0A0P0WSS7_ORYSJ|nr:hypothetical protein DAI22_06g031300 [Oryza sativa Japonica Group]BAS96124.1 Os06g0144500 [Oryza sativa Japonica Group]